LTDYTGRARTSDLGQLLKFFQGKALRLRKTTKRANAALDKGLKETEAVLLEFQKNKKLRKKRAKNRL